MHCSQLPWRKRVKLCKALYCLHVNLASSYTSHDCLQHIWDMNELCDGYLNLDIMILWLYNSLWFHALWGVLQYPWPVPTRFPPPHPPPPTTMVLTIRNSLAISSHSSWETLHSEDAFDSPAFIWFLLLLTGSITEISGTLSTTWVPICKLGA